MAFQPIVRDEAFEVLADYPKTDAKKRISLGSSVEPGLAYTVYRNAHGQIILDPVKIIPAAEAWLYANPRALAWVKQGIREIGEGKLVDRSSYVEHAED